MLVWIIIAVMTGLAALALLWPLSRHHAPLGGGIADATSLYTAQMAEIERDIARGQISPSEADAARAEAGRRLLRADGELQSEDGSPAHGRRRLASLFILLVVPVIALWLYGTRGAPDLPGQPLAARLSTDPAQLDINVAVAKIEAHLALNPADGKGWDVIAPVYLRMGRAEDAAKAFAAAIRLNGPSAERLSGLGEAHAVVASGVITAEARIAFEQAVALDSSLPRPRFFLAVALEQDGKPDEALAAFRAIAATSPQGAPWLAAVQERIERLSGVPSAGAAIAGLPPAERMAAIRGMVQGLSERLQTGGGTLEEWMRLIRAQTVLGDAETAKASLATARQRLGEQGGAPDALAALARELGLGAQPGQQ